MDLLDVGAVLANFDTIRVPPLDGDLNWDGLVNLVDLAIVLGNFGAHGDP